MFNSFIWQSVNISRIYVRPFINLFKSRNGTKWNESRSVIPPYSKSKRTQHLCHCFDLVRVTSWLIDERYFAFFFFRWMCFVVRIFSLLFLSFHFVLCWNWIFDSFVFTSTALRISFLLFVDFICAKVFAKQIFLYAGLTFFPYSSSSFFLV